MARTFADIAFTPRVRQFQARRGSRSTYAALDDAEDVPPVLGQAEIDFLHARDGFFQASVGETGWPYVQFRGGPLGFLKVLGPATLGYADFRGNAQYISAGNLEGDARIALIALDHAQQRRLKVWGRARLVDAGTDPGLIARLEVPTYRARVERAVIIELEAFDWNCPQHIVPRYSADEIEAALDRPGDGPATLRDRLSQRLRATGPVVAVGDGPLSLVVSGVQQLTPQVRGYTLRRQGGEPLPPVAAGAHIDLPLPNGAGAVSSRRYSIASDPARHDAWEVAILAGDRPGSGSAAIHAGYAVGLQVHVPWPGNHFRLHDDDRPALLIAGGIGITPLRSMAFALRASGRPFELHASARSREHLPWADELMHALGRRFTAYGSDTGPRMDVDALLRTAPADAVVYVCGPARLTDAVCAAASRVGALPRVRSERFAPPQQASDAPLVVALRRSARRIPVDARQTILEALEAAGVAVPAACRSGSCRRCVTPVLDGTPDHRDAALTPEERERLMCLCVSRALTAELVLDL